jgi:tetratricopeptide (TPR) repeat protein
MQGERGYMQVLRRIRAGWLLWTLALGLGLWLSVSLVQRPAEASQGRAATTTLPQVPSPTTLPQAPSTVPERELDNLQHQVDSLRDQQNLVLTVLLVPLGLLIAVLFSGGLYGIVTSVRNENRVRQMHEFAVASGTASELRVEQANSTFLGASQQTLTLVNETLQLAKDASERAAQTLAQKANRSLEAIDDRAQDAIRPGLLSSEFRDVVEEASIRSSIIEVANELSSIEGYLRLQDVDLTDNCYFVKGIERHLRQDPHSAVRNLWEAVEHSNDTDLVGTALYWIGYEYNNLGNFLDAERTFRRALERQSTSSARFFELKRISIESRFFQVARNVGSSTTGSARGQIAGIESELHDLLKETPKRDEFKRVSGMTRTTHGNVLSWATTHSTERSVRERLLHDSAKLFEEAGDSLWPLFGLLECQTKLKRKPSQTGYKRVIDLAVDRLARRLEPRSLVLLHETRLIAEIRLRRTSEVDAAYRDLQAALNQVDRDLTIYSQQERWNLKSDEYQKEVRNLYEGFRRRRREPTPDQSPDGPPATPLPTTEILPEKRR